MSLPHDLPRAIEGQPTWCAYPALPPPIPAPLATTPAHPCPYLPGRQATLRVLYIRQLPGSLYHDFLNAAFRRAGLAIYQPACRGCRACVPLRVVVERFQPSKSQRRCWKRNQDLNVTIAPPLATDEKFALYQRYESRRHGSPPKADHAAFEDFLYSSPVTTLEFCYRDERKRLLAVGICDICDQSLSSVYCFYDPDESLRSLGTFGALWEIEFASNRGLAHYYLGYWIRDCRKMRYKAGFRPCELLGPDGVWRGL